jgi:mercuric ion transport protein
MADLVRSTRASLADEPETGAPTSPRLLAAGGILAAIGASSCCVIPFALFSLGVGGAWIGNLTALARYQPAFIAAALLFIGAGFWQVHRNPKQVCADGSSCTPPASNRRARISLWIAAILVVIAALFPIIARLVLEA